MRRMRLVLMMLGTAGLVGAVALAETKVEIENVHLCCGACVKAVGKALKGIDGVTGKCDREKKTVSITAPDDATAQKAVEALATAGFHGRPDTKAVHFPRDSGATKDKVTTLTVSGVHNCCAQCCKAIKAAVSKVTGVTGDTAKPKGKTFEVTGDYEGQALVRALHQAGFHVKVEK